MSKKLRRLISSGLCKKICSFFLYHDRSHGRMAIRDRYEDIKKILQTDSPVIVDGGANVGEVTALFLSQYLNPIIHVFEPVPELAMQLNARFVNHKNVVVHALALGAEKKTISFNVLNYVGSSSPLLPTDINKSYHGQKMDVARSLQVQQIRLDEVFGEVDELDVLKLDIQGYELEALKGCEALIKNIKIVVTEIEFVPLYERQPLFGDVDLYLRENGFKLLNLYDLFTHPDGQLTAGDAVYLNTRYF